MPAEGSLNLAQDKKQLVLLRPSSTRALGTNTYLCFLLLHTGWICMHLLHRAGWPEMPSTWCKHLFTCCMGACAFPCSFAILGCFKVAEDQQGQLEGHLILPVYVQSRTIKAMARTEKVSYVRWPGTQ